MTKETSHMVIMRAPADKIGYIDFGENKIIYVGETTYKL